MFQHELKNAYIGEMPPIDLLSDIVVYYSMEWNLNDDWPSGFNLNVTTGSYTGATNWIETSSSFGATNTSATYPTNSSVTTTIWMNWTGWLYLGSDSYRWWGMNTEVRSSWSWVNVVVSWRQFWATQNTSLSWWNMITGVFDYSAHTVTYYQNWNLITSTSTNSWWLRWGVVIGVWWASSKIWITFVTANAMTQAEIQKFYNASKGIYWL